MFTADDRVKDLRTGMLGTVYLSRMVGDREEVRVLFDPHDTVSPWTDATNFKKV